MEILIIISIFLSFFFLQLFLFKMLKKWDKPTEKSYEELINILNLTITRELENIYTVEYRLRELKMIPDFTKELKKITMRIMDSFSKDFLKELEYYHTHEYIITYVAKAAEKFLIEFTDKHKIKTK